jgi:D-alanine-D-alanine ligase
MLGLPYTGSGVLASALAMDKALSKTVFEAGNVPTPAWQLVRPGEGPETVRLQPPFVVKPPREGSTLGIEIVRSADETAKALAASRQYDDAALVETFVEGRELTVGIVDGQALPIVEIEPEGGF